MFEATPQPSIGTMGAKNGLQCQKGLPIAAFVGQSGTNEACLDALERQRWPTGFVCPGCPCTEGRQFQCGGQRLYACRQSR